MRQEVLSIRHGALFGLYLNGELQGAVERPLEFTWDVEKAAIMIGILYIGDFDDLAIFNRALTAEEVLHLRNLPRGVSGIIGDRRD